MSDPNQIFFIWPDDPTDSSPPLYTPSISSIPPPTQSDKNSHSTGPSSIAASPHDTRFIRLSSPSTDDSPSQQHSDSEGPDLDEKNSKATGKPKQTYAGIICSLCNKKMKEDSWHRHRDNSCIQKKKPHSICNICGANLSRKDALRRHKSSQICLSTRFKRCHTTSRTAKPSGHFTFRVPHQAPSTSGGDAPPPAAHVQSEPPQFLEFHSKGEYTRELFSNQPVLHQPFQNPHLPIPPLPSQLPNQPLPSRPLPSQTKPRRPTHEQVPQMRYPPPPAHPLPSQHNRADQDAAKIAQWLAGGEVGVPAAANHQAVPDVTRVPPAAAFYVDDNFGVLPDYQAPSTSMGRGIPHMSQYAQSQLSQLQLLDPFQRQPLQFPFNFPGQSSQLGGQQPFQTNQRQQQVPQMVYPRPGPPGYWYNDYSRHAANAAQFTGIRGANVPAMNFLAVPDTTPAPPAGDSFQVFGLSESELMDLYQYTS